MGRRYPLFMGHRRISRRHQGNTGGHHSFNKVQVNSLDNMSIDDAWPGLVAFFLGGLGLTALLNGSGLGCGIVFFIALVIFIAMAVTGSKKTTLTNTEETASSISITGGVK